MTTRAIVAAHVTTTLDAATQAAVFADRHYRTLKRLDDAGAFGSEVIATLIIKFKLTDKRGRPASVETFRQAWKHVGARKRGEAVLRTRHAAAKNAFGRALVSKPSAIGTTTPAATKRDDMRAPSNAHKVIEALFEEHNASLPKMPVPRRFDH